MNLEQKIRMLAGTLVVMSLALGWWISPFWFLLAGFVGVNLLQSALTNWCLMEDIFRRVGIYWPPRATWMGLREPRLERHGWGSEGDGVSLWPEAREDFTSLWFE